MRYRIEVLGRSESPIANQEMSHFPFRIGRGLDNDLILSDPSVSAEHLEVRMLASGDLEVFDLESTNGTFFRGMRRRSCIIEGYGQVRVGDILIEFVSEEFSTEKTREITLAPTEDSRVTQIVIKAIVLHLLLWFYSMFKTEVASVGQILTLWLSVLAIVLILSIIVSLISKLNTKSYRFVRAFDGVLTFFLIAEFAFSSLIALSFYSYNSGFVDSVRTSGQAAIIWLSCFFSVCFVNPSAAKKSNAVFSSIVCILFLFIILRERVLTRHQIPQSSYLPPSFVAPNASESEFTAQLRGLFED